MRQAFHSIHDSCLKQVEWISTVAFRLHRKRLNNYFKVELNI